MEQTNSSTESLHIMYSFIYLMSCALNEQKPDRNVINGVDFEKLYRLSKFHSLTSMIYMALEDSDLLKDMDSELNASWKNDKEKAVYKNMILNEERRQVLRSMDDAGIWYLPVKGSILQYYYPKFGMRQMSDNDILYDKSRQNDLVVIMQQHGFEADMVGKTSTDVFIKKPIFNFEMHTSLFGLTSPMYDYYSKIGSKMLHDGESACGYRLSDEDFYIYILAHAYKHFDGGGTGLRTLADSYVYLRKKADSMDWDYIEKELSKLGLTDFERCVRELSFKLFESYSASGKLELSDEEQEQLYDFYSSGTYGTLQKQVSRSLHKVSGSGNGITFSDKLKYVISRAIPTDIDWYRERVPLCAKFKVLIPFYLVFRAIRGVLFRGKNIFPELRLLLKTKSSDKQPNSSKDGHSD